MRTRHPLYPKSLLILIVCALQSLLGTAGGAAPAISQTTTSAKIAAPASQATSTAAIPVATRTLATATQATPAAAIPSVGREFATATPAAPSAEAAAATASASVVFPKITPRWNKWGLDLIEQHGRKNGWQPLPADSLRIVSQPQGFVGQGHLVDLKTGEVTVLKGSQDAAKVRPFKLQAPELDDLKRILTSKPYQDLATEGRPAGLDGGSLLVESDWQGEYRWRLYWVDAPYPLNEILSILQKAQTRERGDLPR